MPRNSYKQLDGRCKHSVSRIMWTIVRFFTLPLLVFKLTLSSYSNADEQYDGILKGKSAEISKRIRIQPLMQTSALGGAAITSVLKQKNGQLWVAEQSGLHLHDGQKLVSFNTVHTEKHFAPSIDISSITEDAEGNIWASSRSTGITKYNLERRIFLNIQGLPNNSVSQIAFMSDDTLIYIHHNRLYGYRISTGSHNMELQGYTELLGLVSKIQVEDNTNAVIVSDLGAFRLNIDNNIVTPIAPVPLYTSDSSYGDKQEARGVKSPAILGKAAPVQILRSRQSNATTGPNSLPLTAITALHLDLFFAGTDDGLYVFRRDGSFVERYSTRNSGLTNDHITHLYSDGDILWVGTYEGLCYLKVSDFEVYNYLSDSISNEVLDFSQDQLGNVWVGTYDGIFRLDPEGTSHTSFSVLFPELSLFDSRVMALDVTGMEMLIGTRSSGLVIIDLASGDLVPHNIEANQGLEVTKILRLSETTFFVSSFNFGLYSLEKNSTGHGIQWLANRVVDHPITILERHAGNIIAANEKSIYFYEIDTQKYKEVDVVFSQTESQPIITALHSTSKNTLLIGTQSHGLFSVDFGNGNNKDIHAIPELKEVQTYATGVWSIEEDSENRLWVATSNGLFLYSADFKFLRRYTAADGLQANKFNFGASLSDRDGFLYFGGSRGYNRFHPNQVPSTTSPPLVLITAISVSGNQSPPRASIEGLESILLSHKDPFITFEFSALDYTDPESTRYRHKLVGFDADWVDIGSRGSATYTNLPSGDYVFRVQAVNSAGIWNYDGLSINLKVKPAPWLTWWACTAYFIMAIGILGWAWRFQRNNILRDQQLKHANELQQIADRVADDLLDQIDFQSKLNDSMHYYNKQLLYWTRFCTDTTVEYEPTDTALAHDRIKFRLDVLGLVQDSLYYRGEQLYAQVDKFVTLLVNKLCSDHPQVCSRLTSVNDVQKELVPAARAVPVAIILAELFDNSLKHAFTGKSAACFVRFSLAITPNMSSKSDTFKLVYQDDGDGIPAGLSFESPESAGFAIIRHAAETLGCEVEISDQDRSVVTASFDLPWS